MILPPLAKNTFRVSNLPKKTTSFIGDTRMPVSVTLGFSIFGNNIGF